MQYVLLIKKYDIYYYDIIVSKMKQKILSNKNLLHIHKQEFLADKYFFEKICPFC